MENLQQLRLLRRYQKQLDEAIQTAKHNISSAQAAIREAQERIRLRYEDIAADQERITRAHKSIQEYQTALTAATHNSIELGNQLDGIDIPDEDQAE